MQVISDGALPVNSGIGVGSTARGGGEPLCRPMWGKDAEKLGGAGGLRRT